MKKKVSINIIFSVMLQVVAIVNSFVVSKVTITYFGSSINGLVASINQFLNYISLLEGGVGAVVMANLYKPLYENDEVKIAEIIYSSKKFFKKIILIYFIYTIFISFIFPVITDSPLDYKNTILLVWILSISLCAQYFYAISYKILLQADHKLYICCIVQIISYILNVIFIFISCYINIDIILLKLFSSIAFLLQPILYTLFVKKYYNFSYKINTFYKLKGRWDGFFQNLSYFINNNTDIVLITMMIGLNEVSVYAVYMLVVNGMKSMIISISSGFQSILGRKIAADNKEDLYSFFKKYSLIILYISLIGFSLVVLFIRQFVCVYVGDADYSYNRVLFPILIAFSQLIICIREPLNLIINSANKFKETNFGAFLESFMNIFISILLVKKFGLIGVAIGTLVASIIRLVYFLFYLNKHIIFIKYRDLIKPLILIVICLLLVSILYFKIEIVVSGWISLIKISFLFGIGISICYSIFCLLIWPKDILLLIKNKLNN